MRNWILMLGVVLWIGTLSPEIFIDTTAGCIFDENGEALDKEEAQEFMQSYFYGGKNPDETAPTLEFKLGLAKLLNKEE